MRDEVPDARWLKTVEPLTTPSTKTVIGIIVVSAIIQLFLTIACANVLFDKMKSIDRVLRIETENRILYGRR